MKDTVVVDLDGTLANIDHRLHFVKREKPDWDGFYEACVNDTPNEWCVHLIRAMAASGFRVLVISARSKVVEEQSHKWIYTYVGERPYRPLILLREERDYTPDDELKIKWLNSYGKERILFVVDDRQRVVDMWRKEGLVCLQCYSWPEWK